jgi:hypothetical protein
VEKCCSIVLAFVREYHGAADFEASLLALQAAGKVIRQIGFTVSLQLISNFCAHVCSWLSSCGPIMIFIRKLLRCVSERRTGYIYS